MIVKFPYERSVWSGGGGRGFYFEVLKGGVSIGSISLDAGDDGFVGIGRAPVCGVILNHPSVSRFHCVLQFSDKSEIFLIDIGSTHGTFVNKKKLEVKKYTRIELGYSVKFGQSSRTYVFSAGSNNAFKDLGVEYAREGIDWGMVPCFEPKVVEEALEEKNDAFEVICAWMKANGFSKIRFQHVVEGEKILSLVHIDKDLQFYLYGDRNIEDLSVTSYSQSKNERILLEMLCKDLRQKDLFKGGNSNLGGSYSSLYDDDDYLDKTKEDELPNRKEEIECQIRELAKQLNDYKNESSYVGTEMSLGNASPGLSNNNIEMLNIPPDVGVDQEDTLDIFMKNLDKQKSRDQEIIHQRIATLKNRLSEMQNM